MVRELGLDIDVAYLSDSTLDAAVEGAMRNGWGITKANVRAVKAKRGTEKLKLCANILKARNVRNRDDDRWNLGLGFPTIPSHDHLADRPWIWWTRSSSRSRRSAYGPLPISNSNTRANA